MAPRVPHADLVQVVHVVVPAHDEEALLPACLDAVATARARLGLQRPEVTVGVTIVLDDCSDASAAVCRRHRVDTIEVAAASVGVARAAGTDRARDLVRACGTPARHTWIAWTDADSVVGPDWLVDQVEVAEGGADVVLGRVEPDATAAPAVIAQWLLRHPLGRVGVHGAHLGFRLSAYDEVGGVAPLREHEDLDLVTRLHAAGARSGVARSLVLTSSRLSGRTGGGFSGYLADLSAELEQAQEASTGRRRTTRRRSVGEATTS